MTARETPVVFDCQGSQLIGMVHVPADIRARGLITIVAGGPQYRGGVGRLLVQLARELAAGGVPVMRFDYRGLGDSEGRFRGFEDVEADLASAILAFRQAVPELREVVLWGGCDAAAAIMINAWKLPEVTGIVVGNPWVHTEATGDAVVVKHHYGKRMYEMDFWWKVLRLQYNPLPALLTISRSLLAGLANQFASRLRAAAEPLADDPSMPFVPRMRLGLSRFKGDMLLLMSGRSLVSKEFDELVASHADWQQALRAPRRLARHDMPEADQTFSAISTRSEIGRVTLGWILDPDAKLAAIAAVAGD